MDSESRARQRLSGWVCVAMEGIVLTLVVLLPGGFSLVAGLVDWTLFSGVALLLLLWAVRMLVEWRPCLAACPITLCLAGLFLLGTWQITPLSPSVLARVSPATAELNRQLLPDSPE